MHDRDYCLIDSWRHSESGNAVGIGRRGKRSSRSRIGESHFQPFQVLGTSDLQGEVGQGDTSLIVAQTRGEKG